jgi:hypothetical protein
MDNNEQIRHSRKQNLAIIQDYIHRVLLPALDFRGDVSLTPADAGIRSIVYFLEGPEFERRILRAEEMIHRFKRRIRGHKLLLQHGFNVPKILYQDTDQSVRKKYGFFFLVESCMAGVHFNRTQDPVAAASSLGSTLVRMHEITSLRYGWPGELRWQGRIIAGLQLRKQAKAHLRIYRQRQRKFPDKIEGWLKRQPVDAWFPKLRLTTAGLTFTNLLIDADRIAILDLARVRFTPVGRDLAQVHWDLTSGDENSREAFFAAYRRQASDNLRAELKKGLPLFKALYLLRRAADVKNAGRNEVCEEMLLDLCRD